MQAAGVYRRGGGIEKRVFAALDSRIFPLRCRRVKLCADMYEITPTPGRWTVSELTRYVRQLFETDYRLQDLELEGEVSNLRVPGSGHAYFTLKDADAQLKCVMWKSDVIALRGGLPQDGERVIAVGNVSVYEAQGVYQMYCRTLRPAGLGDLYTQFEALKARLQAEGLFDAERKRMIPERSGVIGIVTGAETAALQDVLTVLGRRYPLAHVILAPSPVQGDQAPARLIAALESLQRRGDCDVILLVRGGGSLEDLWCFNDERLVRAIAASTTPLVTGVGHEIDFTLADFAADLRAPTPSAAAELITPITVDDLRTEVDRLRARLAGAFAEQVLDARHGLDLVSNQLARLSPRRQIVDARLDVDALMARAARAMQGRLALQKSRLGGFEKALHAVNPLATLARGYAIVTDTQGSVLRRAGDTAPGDVVNIRLHDGNLTTTVTDQQTGNDHD